VKLAFGLVALAACASANHGTPGTDAAGGSDASGSGSAQQCPASQLATDVGASGAVTCAPLDQATHDAISQNCSVYLGWRDGCDGCTTAPTKWGRASTASCTDGTPGTSDTCTTPSLGGEVQLFGVNTDGDVDSNDKLYGSLHCAPSIAGTGALAPCKAGEFVTGMLGSSWTCAPLAVAVVDYVRTSCSLYLGWQDNCDGCITAPVKWGHAGDGGCQNGAGTDDTCSVAMLGGESVNLFGLNPDGNVDSNDKIHVGLDCVAPAPAGAPSTTVCPPGQFVTATATDGSFQCQSAAPLFAKYFTEHCTLYFGWQDSCDGCVTPPAKWGQARVRACSNGAGADDTCTTFTLGGVSVDLFGLNPDGDVDGNDTFYVGFQCS